MASDEAERLAAWCEEQAGYRLHDAGQLDGMYDDPHAGDNSRETAEKLTAIAALLRTPAPAPEGWRCVPVEPTPEMVKKGWASGDWRNLGEDDEAEPAAIWRAMLAASPAPPAHAELVGRLRDRAASMEDSDGMSSDTSILLTEAANALSPE